jgi:hypothetical protein
MIRDTYWSWYMWFPCVHVKSHTPTRGIYM